MSISHAQGPAFYRFSQRAMRDLHLVQHVNFHPNIHPVASSGFMISDSGNTHGSGVHIYDSVMCIHTMVQCVYIYINMMV